ncbi:MAG: hypothetical protein HY720_13830 [Planctomycetes bacterium]|nr:hypothetical protein [Planctomycetota bacterium]
MEGRKGATLGCEPRVRAGRRTLDLAQGDGRRHDKGVLWRMAGPGEESRRTAAGTVAGIAPSGLEESWKMGLDPPGSG